MAEDFGRGRNMSAKILLQAPVLFARDLSKTLAYWNDKLGFESRNVVGAPPQFAILGRSGAFVMLRQAPADYKITPYHQIEEGLWNAFFWVDDAKGLFDEMKTRGAEIDYEPCKQVYGVIEFGIRDPDGQGIGFGQEICPSLQPAGKP